MGIFELAGYPRFPVGGVPQVLEEDLPLSLSLGVLGLNGLTLFRHDRGLQAQGGRDGCVSTGRRRRLAAGQIAKIRGCRVVGITGGRKRSASVSKIQL